MDPMQAPVLVIRNLEKFLDNRTKKIARMVNKTWKKAIDEEGELSLLIYPANKENKEFISRIRKPYSLCFVNKDLKPGKNKENDSLNVSLPLRIHIMCESNFGFLKRQLFPKPRAILTELVFSGNFLWKSELLSVEQELLDYKGERCFLPCLKALIFCVDKYPSKVFKTVEYNSWGSTFRQQAQRNIHFILRVLCVPFLKTYISESVCCYADGNTRNIKSITDFFNECSKSLKTVKMSNQRSDVLKNYREDIAVPNVEELVILLFDIGVGLEVKMFDPKSYWGKFLKAQTRLKKIRWNYLAHVPKEFVYELVLSNQDSLEEFIFSCEEDNTRMVFVYPNVTDFDLGVFARCSNLKKLSLSVDWEIANIDMLPNNIETLIFQGCLITNENLTLMNLSKVTAIEISRNIFSSGTGREGHYEISEETIKFLTHIRSLDSLFVEKLKDDVSTGKDNLEEYFRNYAEIAVPIPAEKFFPDHFVSLKL